jgi:cell division protein FtsZ
MAMHRPTFMTDPMNNNIETPAFRQLQKSGETHMTIEMIEVEEFNLGTLIKVIGVGGGGSNAVDHMISIASVQGVDFVCANTDAQALSAQCTPSVTIQLAPKRPRSAGSKPDKGREAAEAAI